MGGGSLLPLYLVSLELIEEEKLLLSSSLDHTVRLWSTDGEYIGMECPPSHQRSPGPGPQMEIPSGREFSEVKYVS